jgi:hypothetical protein
MLAPDRSTVQPISLRPKQSAGAVRHPWCIWSLVWQSLTAVVLMLAAGALPVPAAGFLLAARGRGRGGQVPAVASPADLAHVVE